jgi:DNA-binding response OmpR family regulator
VDVVGDGKRAVYQAAITEYDAVILDVVLPLQEGLSVCRAIRQEGSAVPILMLTARDAVGPESDGHFWCVDPTLETFLSAVPDAAGQVVP